MPYSRYPPARRRYTQRFDEEIPSAPAGEIPAAPMEEIPRESAASREEPIRSVTPAYEPLRIPLPNEVELTEDAVPAVRRKKSSILDTLREHIGLEEIILIGLILLLLFEAFDDDLLLVMLIYIFLTGIIF